MSSSISARPGEEASGTTMDPAPSAAGAKGHVPESHPESLSGEALCGIGRSTDRIELYREILRCDPTSRVFAFLAEELCANELWQETVETCRKGLALHPHHLRARVLLGRALHELGQLDQADAELVAAHNEFARNAELYAVLAKIAQSQGDTNRADGFSRIYDALRPGQPKAAPAQPPVAEEPIAETVKPTEPRVVTFLSALLERHELSPMRSPEPQTLFTDLDRESLKQVLAAASV